VEAKKHQVLNEIIGRVWTCCKNRWDKKW